MFLIYCRVSTIEQASEHASSIPDQLAKCKAVATLRGAQQFDVVTFVEEGVSGTVSLGKRPQGSEMMEAAQKGDTIIALKMDRMFRSASDALFVAEKLKERGIGLILADLGTDPVTGKGTSALFFGILAVLAQFERERIHERTSDGRKAKIARRGHMGGEPPFGFEVVGHGREARLEPKPTEFEAVQTIKKLYHEHTAASATREAARLGLRSRAGTPFQQVQIKRIAERELHLG